MARAVGPQADEFQATVVSAANLNVNIHVSGPAGLDLPPDWAINGGGTVQFTVNGLSASTVDNITLTATLLGTPGSATIGALAEGTDGVFVTTSTSPLSGISIPASSITTICVGGGHCRDTTTITTPTGSPAAAALSGLVGQRYPSALLSGYLMDCTRAPVTCTMTDLTPIKLTSPVFGAALSSSSGKVGLTVTYSGTTKLAARTVIPPNFAATIHIGATSVAAASVSLLEPARTTDKLSFLTRNGDALPVATNQTWTVSLSDGEAIKLTGVSDAASVTLTGSAQAGSLPPGGYHIYTLSYTGRVLSTPALPTLTTTPTLTATTASMRLACAATACQAIVSLQNATGTMTNGARVTMNARTETNVTLTYTTYGKNEYATLKAQHKTIQASVVVQYTGKLADQLTKSYRVTFP